MSRTKAADVRFYFDADVLGVAKVIAALRPDTTYPGDPGATVNRRIRPACPVRPDAKDREWIPRVADLGWLIITRDSRIQHHLAELEAVRESGAKMIALSGKEGNTKWNQLEIVMSSWRRIEAVAEEPGPFIQTATRTGLSRVDLDRRL